eukprot:evm.model.scf_440.8 EVM.evm.TU.scf_440.8   scf_440:59870-61408(+)
MAVTLEDPVDCLASHAGPEGGALLAVGCSHFTGRWWSGHISVYSADDLAAGAERPRSGAASLRSGVTGVDWMEARGRAGQLCLISGCDDGSVVEWDVFHDGEAAPRIQYEQSGVSHSSLVTSVAAQSAHSRVASSSFDGLVHIWDAAAALSLTSTLSGHTGHVWGARWNPIIPTSLASVSQDGAAKVWSLSQRQQCASHRVGAPAYCLAWLGEDLLVVGDEIGRLSWFDARKPGEALRRARSHTDCVRALAASEDGERLAAAGDDGKVVLIAAPSAREAASGAAAVEVCSFGAYARGLAWGGGGLLFSGSWGGEVAVSAVDGKCGV